MHPAPHQISRSLLDSLERSYSRKRVDEFSLVRIYSIYRLHGLTLGILSDTIGRSPSWWSTQFARMQLPAHSSSHRPPGSVPARFFALENPRAFRKIDSAEKAHLVGFFFADAKPLGRPGKGTGTATVPLEGVELTIGARDRWILDAMCDLLQVEKTYSVNRAQLNGRSYACLTKRIYSVALGRDIEHLGIVPARTRENRAPPSIPKALRKHLVRGLIDGDGWITRSGKVRDRLAGWSIGICGSMSAVTFVQTYMSRMGIRANMILQNGRKNGICWKTSWHGVDALRVIEHLYEGETFALPRKRDVAHAIIAALRAAYPGGAMSIHSVRNARGRTYMTHQGRVNSPEAQRLGKQAVRLWKLNWHPTRGRRAVTAIRATR